MHAFGISEVFNISDNDKDQKRQEIMTTILSKLNESDTRHFWTGKADVHYIFIWNTDALQCCDYEVISCGIEEQVERKAQYFQFQTVPNGEPLHIYHNHSPSSKNASSRLAEESEYV